MLGTVGRAPIESTDVATYEQGISQLTISRLKTGHDLGQFGDPAELHAALGAFLDVVDAER